MMRSPPAACPDSLAAVPQLVDGGRRNDHQPDRDPLPVVRFDPDYPQRAINGEIEGWAEVQFSVTATGAVRDVVIVDSHPKNVFDDAVIKAVGRWRYNPKVDEGVAVDGVEAEAYIACQTKGPEIVEGADEDGWTFAELRETCLGGGGNAEGFVLALQDG